VREYRATLYFKESNPGVTSFEKMLECLKESRIPMMAITIALFCAAGGLVRYYLSGWVHGLFGWAFPYGTLAVNVLGAYFIGLIMELGLSSAAIPGMLRVGLTAGFMGGLTTFSTFSYETFKLLEDGRFALACTNVVVSVVVCLLFTWLGIITVRAM
jgi:CrcB protein